MTRAGVLVSVNSDGEDLARHFNHDVARLRKHGDETENEALALVTLNPARQLGVDDRVGSIDVGKDADLVVYNHYPLSVYAVPEMVFIDGKLYWSREGVLSVQLSLAMAGFLAAVILGMRMLQRGERTVADRGLMPA